MDVGGGEVHHTDHHQESSSAVSGALKSEGTLPACDTDTLNRTAYEGELAPEVLRMRGSTSRMHARHVSQAAHAAAIAEPSTRQDDSEQDSTKSIAVSSVIDALHELAAHMHVDAAAAAAAARHSVNEPKQGNMHTSEAKKPNTMHAHSLGIGCTPSVGSTCSGPLGGAAGGLTGKPKGPWRGARDVTESYIMHTLHARSEGPAVESGGARLSLQQGVEEVEEEGPPEQAACNSMHGNDIDEIDDTSTQLSGRSGSWLCLPGPPPVAHGGVLPHMHRRSSGATGSMHISASMNMGGDTTLDRASTGSCAVASSWLVAFGGNACGPREGGVGGAVHMGKNSSVASHSEVAV